MNTNRKIAISVGVLFIIGTGAGILSAVVSAGLLAGADYLDQVAAHANQVTLAALLILLMGIALAMIPALMFPILKKRNEPLAIGYIIFRGAVETFTYIGMATCWLLLVVVARQSTDAGAAAQLPGLADLLLNALPISAAIVSIFFGVGALMLYYLLYQGKLIPRWISIWGVVAAVLTVVPGVLSLVGVDITILQFVMLPQEIVMAVWLIVKGFNLKDDLTVAVVASQQPVAANVAALRPQHN